MGLLSKSLAPINPSQAKKAGTWDDLMARLALCVIPADLDAFEREAALEDLPRQWRDPLADQIALRREEIAAEDIGRVVRERFDFT